MIDKAKAPSSAPTAPEQCDTWKSLPWRRIEKKVFRLQLRIAKAVREKRFNRAKALQWMLTHSRDAKLLAVKRVTENRGARTPGVDKELWRSSNQKAKAATTLTRRGYKALPLRRVYIPKSNGESRPLGIPTIKDRAMQALYLLSLEPITETNADHHAYGFRPMRSTSDAMSQCFNALAQKTSSRFVLEGDIKACFEQISHEWLLNNVHMDKSMLRKWLKAGFIEKRTLFPTKAGTPQGGIISPCLAVATMSGLEQAAKQAVEISDKVHVVSYADDFIITGASKEVLENKVLPAVKAFLDERGLRLSEKKTKITSIDEGFDFLGCNVRKYNGKLLIKPSKQNVKALLIGVREIFRSNMSAETSNLIRLLNAQILGWAYYYRSTCAKQTFNAVDNRIAWYVYRWTKRRHPNKNRAWIRKRYFRVIGFRNWVFSAPLPSKSQKPGIRFLSLAQAASIPIKRHIKIKGAANPYDPDHLPYLAKRNASMSSVKSKWTHRVVAHYGDGSKTHGLPGLERGL